MHRSHVSDDLLVRRKHHNVPKPASSFTNGTVPSLGSDLSSLAAAASTAISIRESLNPLVIEVHMGIPSSSGSSFPVYNCPE